MVGQNSQGQKVIIQPAPQSTTATTLTGQAVTTTAQAIPQPTNQINTTQQHVIVNQTVPSGTQSSSVQQQQQSQKVIQTIVNTSNVQQQILVGGQRIILSPGQTILTQRSIPAQSSSVQVVPSTTSTQVNTIQKTSVQQQTTSTVQQNIQQPSKVLKQFVIQSQTSNGANTIDAQKQQQQQNVNNTPSISTSSHHTTNNQQQIIVQNSTLAQQLAQGKLQVATINGQQVIIKPLGNNQAQIVAHIKTQSDGNAHIVTNTTVEPQSSPTKPTPSSQVVRRCDINDLPIICFIYY